MDHEYFGSFPYTNPSIDPTITIYIVHLHHDHLKTHSAAQAPEAVIFRKPVTKRALLVVL